VILFTCKVQYLPVSRGQTHLYLDNLEKAIKILESSLKRSVIPRHLGCMAIAYNKDGRDRKAQQLVEQLNQMSQEKAAGSPEYFTALFYSGTGPERKRLSSGWKRHMIPTIPN